MESASYMQNSVQDTTILDYKAVNYINGSGDCPLFMRTSSGWRSPLPLQVDSRDPGML